MEKRRSNRGKKDKSPQLPTPKYTKAKVTAPLNQVCAWKKSKLKDEGIHALVDAGLMQEKALAGWNIAARDPWPMEKNPDEIPMFVHFIERGLSLPALYFFWDMLNYYKIEHVHLNPNNIFDIAF